MPPGPHEGLVKALEVLDDRQAVHHHQPRDDVRGSIAARNATSAAIMARDSEPVVAELLHERYDVVGHRAL